MVQLLLGHPRFETTDLSFVQICSVGSAPLSPSAVDRLQANGCPTPLVSNNYGMTEAGSVYCLMPKGEAVRRPGSVGKPAPPAEVRCIDDDGIEVPAGELRPDRAAHSRPATASTSTTPRPQRRPGWTVGCARATSAGSTRTATSTSAAGPRTSSSGVGTNIHAVDVENVIAHPSGCGRGGGGRRAPRGAGRGPGGGGGAPTRRCP